MLLYREGELPPDRRAEFTRHLASCAECAREAERVASDLAPLDALRRVQPVLNDANGLTLGIMREIEAAPSLSVVFPARFVDRFLAVARVAGAIAGSVLVLLYVTLSYDDARTVASLEQRLAQRDTERGSTAEQLAREAVSQFGSHTAYAEAGLRPDEVGRTLRALLNPRQEPARVTVEDLLLRKYPALASVTLQDGLDDRERLVLSNEGERFLNDLERLIRKEKP